MALKLLADVDEMLIRIPDDGWDESSRQGLARLLLDLPRMKEVDRRKAIVSQLGDIASSVMESAIPLDHVLDIVTVCSKFPNGTRRLRAVLSYFYEPRVIPPIPRRLLVLLPLAAVILAALAITLGIVAARQYAQIWHERKLRECQRLTDDKKYPDAINCLTRGLASRPPDEGVYHYELGLVYRRVYEEDVRNSKSRLPASPDLKLALAETLKAIDLRKSPIVQNDPDEYLYRAYLNMADLKALSFQVDKSPDAAAEAVAYISAALDATRKRDTSGKTTREIIRSVREGELWVNKPLYAIHTASEYVELLKSIKDL